MRLVNWAAIILKANNVALQKKGREIPVEYSYVFSNPSAIGTVVQVEASPEDTNADELMSISLTVNHRGSWWKSAEK